MIRLDDLTPRQRRLCSRAARSHELRGVYLVMMGFWLLFAFVEAFLGYRRLPVDPAGARLTLFSAFSMAGTAAVALALTPVFDLLSLLCRALEASGSLGAGTGAGPGPARPLGTASAELAPQEGGLVASARQLEGLGWGAIRGALLALLLSGLAVIAAALWRFGGESDGLGAAALAMAASGGLTLGVALGGLALVRWMRLAARLGTPAAGPEGEGRAPL
jgi:hypothetical protein